MQLIRTLSLIPIQIKITYDNNIPLYIKLAPKIRKLKALRMGIKKGQNPFIHLGNED